MARSSATQKRVLSPSSSEISTSKSTLPFLKVALVLFFILIPLVLPLYKAGQLQPYLPQQLQSWLTNPPREQPAPGLNNTLSPEQILQACEVHQYSTQMISLSPLVIYINNFTSAPEAEELINIGSPDFSSSFISGSRGANTLATGRTSLSAPLDQSHPLVSCILTRARTFMSSMVLPHEPFSVPQLVKYAPGQKYDLHTDFWPAHQVMNDGSGRLFNRVASFFVFLRASEDIEGGETWFPGVQVNGSDKELAEWYSGKVERGEVDGEKRKGVKFKPIQGNAIFWVNLNEKGEGDQRVVHAGLPVGKGEKIGLNIWPRKFYETEDGQDIGKEKKAWSGKWKE